MIRIYNLIQFLTINFGPLAVFYIANAFWGFKTAVLASIATTVLEFLYLKIQKHKISSFFYFTALIVIVFGVLDLTIKEPFFFKFEATLTNLFFAIFFGLSLFKDKSIIQEFAETQKRTSEEQSEDKKFFFRMFTIFWCAYFTVKAVFFLWINFSNEINQALLIRMAVGKVSFWVMMFISIGIPRQIWNVMERLKLFPSQRIKPLILRELTVNDEKAFLAGLENWKNEELSWYTFSWKPGMSHAEHLADLEKFKDKSKVPKDFVPATTLYAFVDGQIVGRLNIRYELNENLLFRGGNIGYAVSPLHRNKGYATEIFRQGIQFSQKLGLKKLLVTCADQNIHSWKVIEKFSAVLENKIFDEEEDEYVRRYWVDLISNI